MPEVSGQEINFPKIILTDVPTNISVKNIPNDIDTINLIVKTAESSETYYQGVQKNSATFNLNLSNTGTHSFFFYELTTPQVNKRVYPGWLSIVPPLIAILLALIFRQVFVSLLAGIYIGLLFLYDFNPLTALLRLFDTNILNAIIDTDHMYIILFTLFIGGVVGVISKNGGTIGLANVITKFAKTPRSGMLSSWLMGIVIFFDDYANSLIIGNMMRPITDKLKISREKLAYIIDSTAAPIASIVIISTWIGYELGLIGEGLKVINSNLNPYEVFIQTIPYRFYPIATVFFVFITAYFKRDFGSMYKAEINARNNGIYNTLETKTNDLDDVVIINGKSKWFNAAIPILIILIGTVVALIFTGINSLEEKGIYEYGLQEIISNSDSYRSLLWSSAFAGIIAIFMSVAQRLIKLEESIKAWHIGVQSMLLAVIILVLAWGISSITGEIKTADYVISILSDKINPRFLPALVFVACGLISFSTGTSWGTMAIVMPIVIPLASHITSLNNYSIMDMQLIIYGVVSSVLAGSVWGDHCSPIADTTILSSLASRCNHIDHVKTQLPYAILVGLVGLILGDIPTAFGFSPYISLSLIFIVLTVILLLFGEKV